MKKLCALIFIALACYAVAADENVFSDIPGSYAIYHDNRFGTEAFIGLCYAGNDTLLVRSYEPDTETECLMFIPLLKTERGIEPGEDINVVIGSFTSSETTQRILPMVLNWAATWNREKQNIKDKRTHSASTDDDFIYESWIPVFNIHTIGTKDEFTIITAGMLHDNTDARFFSFTGIPEPVAADSFKIENGKSSTVTIDGLSVTLDDNWKTEDNKAYRIARETPQDAIFVVETVNYRTAGFTSLEQLAHVIMINHAEILVLADGTKEAETNGSHTIFMRMLDTNQNKVTIQQTKIIERDEETVSLVTLACYETLYDDNKTFFESIMQ